MTENPGSGCPLSQHRPRPPPPSSSSRRRDPRKENVAPPRRTSDVSWSISSISSTSSSEDDSDNTFTNSSMEIPHEPIKAPNGGIAVIINDDDDDGNVTDEDTQPMSNHDDDTGECVNSTGFSVESMDSSYDLRTPLVWGFLTSESKYFHDDTIKTGAWSIGRHVDLNNYVLQPPLIPESDINQFSRIHFKITRSDNNREIYITDMSSNGTYVNRELVGKNRSRPLVHLDRISLAHPDRKAFTFYLTATEKVLDRNSKIWNYDASKDYVIGQKIGEGSCGEVYYGYSRHRNWERVAVKIISKIRTREDYEPPDDIWAEVKILRRLVHPSIIGIKDVYEDTNSLYIILELADGGELFDYVLDDFKNDNLNERVSKFQFYQILKAMEFCHAQSVCHRDLKLENLLMSSKSRLARIKITDFGLSKIVGASALMNSFVGTFGYLAPEVVLNSTVCQSQYTLKADMWSLGCVLYALLSGSPAFFGNTDQELKSHILSGRFDADSGKMEQVSYHAKDLLRKLLENNADIRLNATEAMEHPWFTEDPHIVELAESLISGTKNALDEETMLLDETLSTTLGRSNIADEIKTISMDSKENNILRESNILTPKNDRTCPPPKRMKAF